MFKLCVVNLIQQVLFSVKDLTGTKKREQHSEQNSTAVASGSLMSYCCKLSVYLIHFPIVCFNIMFNWNMGENRMFRLWCFSIEELPAACDCRGEEQYEMEESNPN